MIALPAGTSRRVAIGNRGLLTGDEDLAQAARLEEQFAPELSAGAMLRLFVTVDDRVCGAAVLRERLRESAVAALEELRAAKVELHVMTGDRADHVAALGLSSLPPAHVHGAMSPLDKVALVESMQAGGRHVLFVGDGLNDSAALARADAGLALATGASLSLEAATGRLMGGDLSAVPAAIATCRATMRAVRTNLLFAAGYNLIGVTLAASGVLHPVVAALLMLASSVTVTTRALAATKPTAGATGSSGPGHRRIAGKYSAPVWFSRQRARDGGGTLLPRAGRFPRRSGATRRLGRGSDLWPPSAWEDFCWPAGSPHP